MLHLHFDKITPDKQELHYVYVYWFHFVIIGVTFVTGIETILVKTLSRTNKLKNMIFYFSYFPL